MIILRVWKNSFRAFAWKNFFFIQKQSNISAIGKKSFLRDARRKKGKDTTFVYDIYKSYFESIKNSAAALKFRFGWEYGPMVGEEEKSPRAAPTPSRIPNPWAKQLLFPHLWP